MSSREASLDRATAPISPLNKGIGYLPSSLTSAEIARLGWNLLHEDLSLPAAVLSDSRLHHNLAWMRDFIAASGVSIAPHGKTTMAPKLFKMQLAYGAWGITLATAPQCFVAWQHGIRRILMANQLIGRENMAIVSRLLSDPELDYYCLVDSPAQIEQLGAFFSERGQHLSVLLELGMAGGRTGVRTPTQVDACIACLDRWQQAVSLCGIEVYEGIATDETIIRSFLRTAIEETNRLAGLNAFRRAPILLSGAGSAWYDVVAEMFSSAAFRQPVEIVLRPGCYVTHDVGMYREAQARILASSPIARGMKPGLLPALQVWAYVQSVPEPELAIATLGKRDASWDNKFPVPILRYRPGWPAPETVPEYWRIQRMMDQHAFLAVAEADDLRPGDMLAFDISHPCLTFDKWRVLPVVDDEYRVVDMVTTFF